MLTAFIVTIFVSVSLFIAVTLKEFTSISFVIKENNEGVIAYRWCDMSL